MRKSKLLQFGTIVVLILGIFLVNGCTGREKTSSFGLEVKETSTKKYTNEVYGFSIEYPKNWEVNETASFANLSAIVFFMGPIENNFGTNLNIKTANLGDSTFSEHIKAGKEGIARGFSAYDYMLKEEGEFNFYGRKGYFIEYVWKMQGLTIQQKQFWIKKDEAIYILTFSTTPQDYENWEEKFNYVTSTLEFLNE